MMRKIIYLKNLQTLTTSLKGAKTVLVGGCFDILHIGHVKFLQEAKKHGTLIVALESDETLTNHKGHLRPIHQQIERAEVLAELKSVDFVLLLPHFTSDKQYQELTNVVQPNIIALTEGDRLYNTKETQAKSVGANILVIPKINTPSTTQLAKLLALE